MSKETNSLTMLLSGLAIGALAGVLLAPKSGKESRDEISKKFRDLKTSVEDIKEDFTNKISEVSDEIEKEVKSGGKGIKGSIEKKLKEIEKAVEDRIEDAKSRLEEN